MLLTNTGLTIRMQNGQGRESEIQVKLRNANPSPRMEGLDRTPEVSNYFTGSDPAGWHTGIAHYSRVRVSDVYPGIDLVYYASGERLEFDFVLFPGADTNRIRMRISGGDSSEIGPDGDLAIHSRAGDFWLRKPTAYQETAGGRSPIAARYVHRKGGDFGFEARGYDRTRMLVIDPVLKFSIVNESR